MGDAGARVATSSSSFWPHSLLFPQMLHTSLLTNAALLLKAVPGSDKVDSKMSRLTDGSLVVVVILDVQMPAGDRERRVILVEAGRTLFRASCVRARRRNEGQGELDRADRRLVDSGKERKLRGQLDNHHHPTYTHILLGSF